MFKVFHFLIVDGKKSNDKHLFLLVEHNILRSDPE